MSIFTLRSGGTAHPETSVLQHITDLIANSGVFDASLIHFKAEAQAVPDMTVKVNIGRAYIKGVSTNAYPVRSDADETVIISPNSSGNPRIDAIVLYIDLSATANTDATNVAKLTKVQGTPAASPVAPTDSEIATAIGSANPFIRLAHITVASGATSITNSNISDQRTTFKTLDIGKAQSGSIVYGVDSGSNDAYAVSLDPAVTSYAAGLAVRFKANTVNTGPATLNVNGLGAKTIRKFFNQDLASGDIPAGGIVTVVYDGTNFQLQTVVSPDGWVDLVDAATINIDLSLGKKFRVTIAGNRTFTLSNVIVGKSFALRIRQDGVGNRTVTFWSGLTFAGQTAPTLTTTANRADEFGFNVLTLTTSEGFIIGQDI